MRQNNRRLMTLGPSRAVMSSVPKAHPTSPGHLRAPTSSHLIDPYPARGLRGCCRALARAMGEAGMGVSASRAGAPDGGRKGGGVPAGIPEVSGRQAGLGWADNSSRLWVPPAYRGVSRGPGHPPPHVWDPARYAPVTSPGGPAAGEPNKLQTRGRSRALGNTPSAGSIQARGAGMSPEVSTWGGLARLSTRPSSPAKPR